ncbi:unnamed protein product [Rotaria sp. Silwood1]|nr:unnamed protein product [Rotaria sp. Silwood1]
MDTQLTEKQVSKSGELTEVTVDSTSEVNLSTVMNNTSESQAQQQNTAINIDDRFGPSCASVLSDIEIFDNIIKRSKCVDRYRRLYLFIGCIPTLIITCSIWIIWACINCDENVSLCKTSHTLHTVGIVFACITALIFFWAIYYGAKHYMNGRIYAILRNNVRYLIKLEGEQWISYVNYLYGPDRAGFTHLGAVGAFTFCCCRRPHYQQLIERGYGYIVLCKHGFLLDEMFSVVRNDTHNFLKVVHLLGTGLRVYLLRTDAKVLVSNYDSSETRARKAQLAAIRQTTPLDIYLPNTISATTATLLALQIEHGI